jgi:hypothetical protein
MNRGSILLNYYRYSGSVDEEATAITDGTSPTPTGSVNSTTSPLYALANFCQNSQAVGTGAQSRGTSRTLYMQALMDTLRRQAAPVARLGAYQVEIRQWLLAEQPDTAALEAYVRTLPSTNPEAFFGLGLDLLEQYRRKGRQVAAGRLHPVLAARVGAHPAAEARLALSDVVSRVAHLASGPAAGGRATAADSITLRRLARTPGGTAEMAALWYNYLYPNAGVSAAAIQPARNAAIDRPNRLLSQSAVQALYPNPTADRLHVEVNTPVAARYVVLRLVDLLSGRMVLQAELPTGENGHRQADVDVRALPAGQYAATLLVDGVPGMTQKVMINR